METSFLPLLFGGDINVYSMARAFHEAYGIRSTAYGKYATGVCYESAILDYRVCPQNEDGPTLNSPGPTRTRRCWSSAAATAT